MVSAASSRRNPYEDLINDLETDCLSGISEEEIKIVVQHLENEIHSKRVCSHIRSLNGLIKILEAREILKPNDVKSLEMISQMLQNPLALRRVRKYSNSLPKLNFFKYPSPPPSPLMLPQSSIIGSTTEKG